MKRIVITAILAVGSIGGTADAMEYKQKTSIPKTQKHPEDTKSELLEKLVRKQKINGRNYWHTMIDRPSGYYYRQKYDYLHYLHLKTLSKASCSNNDCSQWSSLFHETAEAESYYNNIRRETFSYSLWKEYPFKEKLFNGAFFRELCNRNWQGTRQLLRIELTPKDVICNLKADRTIGENNGICKLKAHRTIEENIGLDKKKYKDNTDPKAIEAALTYKAFKTVLERCKSLHVDNNSFDVLPKEMQETLRDLPHLKDSHSSVFQFPENERDDKYKELDQAKKEKWDTEIKFPDEEWEWVEPKADPEIPEWQDFRRGHYRRRAM